MHLQNNRYIVANILTFLHYEFPPSFASLDHNYYPFQETSKIFCRKCFENPDIHFKRMARHTLNDSLNIEMQRCPLMRFIRK